MNSDLLPCPFCGASAELVQVREHNGAVVECTGCHASGPLRIHAKEDATPHAIYSWNRREQPTDTDLLDWIARRCDDVWERGDGDAEIHLRLPGIAGSEHFDAIGNLRSVVKYCIEYEQAQQAEPKA